MRCEKLARRSLDKHGIPKAITAADVQRLLDGCDRSDLGGIRDYAILTLVARLGPRSVEVARLQLDDIDWRTGRIRLVRNNLDSAALAKSASLSPSTAADPQRVVSFINVVGCGTAPSSGMRQNRRQVIESATSRHSDS